MSDNLPRRSPEEIFLLDMFYTTSLPAHPLDLVQCLKYETSYYMDLLKQTESGRRWTAQKRRFEATRFRSAVAGLIDLYVVKGRGI